MTAFSIIKGVAVAIGMFVVLGTVAALWENPFFIRMTPTSGFEIGLLALQALLFGAYVAIPVTACGARLAGTGGVAGYIGIACPICNKILVLVFGAEALLVYLEPVRVYLAAAGVLIIALAVWMRWRNYRLVGEPPEDSAPSAEPAPVSAP